MHQKIIRLAAGLLALAAAGCSSSTTTYTCNFASTVGQCFEWSTTESLSSSEVSQLQTACTGGVAGGTFATGATCSSTNRVGTCTFSAYGAVSGVTYAWALYSPTYTATTGQAYCTTAGGTWTAG